MTQGPITFRQGIQLPAFVGQRHHTFSVNLQINCPSSPLQALHSIVPSTKGFVSES